MHANFLDSSNPWFDRAGNFNNEANSGVFIFNNDNGEANVNGSARACQDDTIPIALKYRFKDHMKDDIIETKVLLCL